MSDTDEYMSSDNSSSMQDKSDSDEIEVVGLVEPYANEPPAHSSDDDEDDEEDSDGLSPAVLRARFERQVAVNEWLVIFFLRSNFRIPSHLLCSCSCSQRFFRLRAVSLFLENPLERTQNKKTCKRDCERDLRAAMPRAASSVGVGWQVKRETALVSYNDLMLLWQVTSMTPRPLLNIVGFLCKAGVRISRV